MAFVKEFRDYSEEMPEWDYLNAIGVRDMFGKPIKRNTTEMVLDKHKNFYLIPLGQTGLAHTEDDLIFFELVLNGECIKLETVDDKFYDKENEVINHNWIVKRVLAINGHVYDFYKKEDIKIIIEEALKTKSIVRKHMIPNGYIKVNLENTFWENIWE